MVDEDAQQAVSSSTERVLVYIQKKLSWHFRQLSEELNLGIGTVQYQVHSLEKVGKISSARRGLYRHYFPIGMLDAEKDILKVLVPETAREILMFMIEKGDPSNADISDRIMISCESVSCHIKRWIELDLIGEEKEGKYKRYRLRDDVRTIIALLKNYYPSILAKWSSRLAEMFLSFSKGEQQEP